MIRYAAVSLTAGSSDGMLVEEHLNTHDNMQFAPVTTADNCEV